VIHPIQAALGTCASLHEAILVGLHYAPAWQVVEVVVQDEYTHDVIFAPATGDGAVVLDCT
jgi:hypothetical protein